MSASNWEKIARCVCMCGEEMETRARRSLTLSRPLQVVVHESTIKNMDFNAKNFQYIAMSFGDFAREAQAGKRLYLRALSPDAPADQTANFERDFPALAADFVLPQELVKCTDNIHSSVLRISGPVNMWLHYGTSLAFSLLPKRNLANEC